MIRAALPGPPLAEGNGAARRAETRFVLRRMGDGNLVLEISGQRVPLRPRCFSPWVSVAFSLGRGRRVSGICRFYVKQLEPELELYVSPVNIDPERPAVPISHPPFYCVYLAKRLGRFATLGLAEDTWALNEGALDEEAFLEQCWLLFEERKSMLFSALETTRSGCLVCVFDTTDRVQHMFWRTRERADGPVAEAYRRADALVGEVMSRLGPRDVLLVLSDHGFTDFARGVNLNAWLREQGYLALKPGADGAAEWLRDVDWSRTRAYALGLAGLYLNVRGREASGIVAADEAAALKQELSERLTGLRDPEQGAVAVARVFDVVRETPGPYVGHGPDLVIGYAPGYRASWEAAQGRVSGPVFEENPRHWGGDHCADPGEVPGVLLCNRKLIADGARMIDLAPTILSIFGLPAPAYMEGRSLWPEEGAVSARTAYDG